MPAIDYRLVKPHPDAIATERGWEMPLTGEILSSIKGLKTFIDSRTPVKVVVEPVMDEITAPQEPLKEEPIEEVKKIKTGSKKKQVDIVPEAVTEVEPVILDIVIPNDIQTQ